MYHLIEFTRPFTADVEVSSRHRLEKLTVRDGTRASAQLRPYVVETPVGPVEVADLYFDDGTVARQVPYDLFRFVE